MAEINGNHYRADLLKTHVDRFTDVSVLVVGDIIMDEYLWGDVSRISPEAPVPVVEVNRETKVLGGAANVVNNMASLGSRPILCGVVGTDRTGEEIISKLTTMGLRTDGVIREQGRPTTIKTRVVARGQQVVRFDRETRVGLKPHSIERLLDFVHDNIDLIDAVVISDYGKGVISSTLMEGLNRIVKSRGTSTPILVDPKTGNFKFYKDVDVITPNHHEAGMFCGFEIIDEKTLMDAGMKILQKLNCGSVLITQGKDGMSLFERGADTIHIPTVAKEVFDVTGAGDTVIGTMSLALATGLDLQSAAILSNFAAGIVVGEVGTSTVKADDLKKAIRE